MKSKTKVKQKIKVFCLFIINDRRIQVYYNKDGDTFLLSDHIEKVINTYSLLRYYNNRYKKQYCLSLMFLRLDAESLISLVQDFINEKVLNQSFLSKLFAHV